VTLQSKVAKPRDREGSGRSYRLGLKIRFYKGTSFRPALKAVFTKARETERDDLFTISHASAHQKALNVFEINLKLGFLGRFDLTHRTVN